MARTLLISVQNSTTTDTLFNSLHDAARYQATRGHVNTAASSLQLAYLIDGTPLSWSEAQHLAQSFSQEA
jgi:hypothetical protein